MKTKFRGLARALYGSIALALAGAAILPAFAGEAFAYGQPTSRSIEMSNSTPGTTGVSYSVSFTPASSTLIQAVIVDFCSNDPLVGDSCTAPTGFSVGTPSVTVGSISGETGGTWTASTHNTNRTLEIANGTATGTASGATTFTLTTATNPSAPAATFYARVFTFSSTANATTWLTTTNGSDAGADVLDAGGIALSTANSISITAKVMEQLTFCVSGGTIGTGCSGTTTPTLTLGHGTTTLALDSTEIDTAPAYTQLSTNATSGAIVRMKDTSSTLCGGLSKDGGATCTIPAIGASQSEIPSVTADFGMCVIKGTNTTVASAYSDTGAGNTACSTATPSASSVYYGMDQSTAGNNVISTYGSQVFSVVGPVSNEANTCSFAAQAAVTTPAGIYQANESLIATGTF
ncbi:MAG TPA: hypothetical protein VGG13_02110 [Candidatus Saccharimonadales bacterium]|jgi:hypothetical protein